MRVLLLLGVRPSLYRLASVHLTLPPPPLFFPHDTQHQHQQDGSTVSYTAYGDFEADYASGKIHPGDLKPAVTAAINSILEPVRQHFETDPAAKKLLAQVRAYKTTR